MRNNLLIMVDEIMQAPKTREGMLGVLKNSAERMGARERALETNLDDDTMMMIIQKFFDDMCACIKGGEK